MEPGEEGTKLLDLDDSKLVICITILDNGKENGTIGGWIHGNKIGSVGDACNRETRTKGGKGSHSSIRNRLTEKSGEDMVKSSDIRASDSNHDGGKRREERGGLMYRIGYVRLERMDLGLVKREGC